MKERLRTLLRGDNPETTTWATDKDIFDCFRILLNRRPGDVELGYWRSLIQARGIDRTVIVDAILGSAEFKAQRKARYEPSLVDCGAFDMYVRPNDLFIGQAIVQTGEYEPYVANEVRRLLQPGDTFVDIGANAGYFTLLGAQLVGPEGRVYAFEPGTDNCDLLKRSVAQNRFEHVQLFQKAVAEKAQRVALSSGGADSNARLMRPEEIQGLEEHFDYFESVTLDEALQDVTAVHLIKMDIEGAEPRAWTGMQQVLARHRPVVISEYAPDLIRAASGTEPRDYLEEMWQGHTITILERSGARRAVDSVQQIVDAQAAAAASGVTHLDLLARPRQEG